MRLYGAKAFLDGGFCVLPSVPYGETFLFYKDIAVVGYELLEDEDDQLVYITKGSSSGGDAGGAVKTGSTWTQPLHSHDISSDEQGDHIHFSSPHSHMMQHVHYSDSAVLSLSQIPGHTHGRYGRLTGSYGADSGSGVTHTGYSYLTSGPAQGASGNSHSHGLTNSQTVSITGETSVESSGEGAHSHDGEAENWATSPDWRPYGVCLTRQRRVS
jgi:hypothetical protein